MKQSPEPNFLYSVNALAAHYGVSQSVMSRRIKSLGLAPVARDGALKLFDESQARSLAPRPSGRPRKQAVARIAEISEKTVD